MFTELSDTTDKTPPQGMLEWNKGVMEEVFSSHTSVLTYVQSKLSHYEPTGFTADN